MNHRTESLVESPEKLIRNIQKLMDEVEAIVARSGHEAGEEVGSRLEELQERLSLAADRVRGAYHTARRKVASGARRADDTIRSHPYETLAVTLGLGVLLGAVLRRRH